MKIVDLRRKNKEELQNLLSEDREKLRQLRFNLASGKAKNIREIRKIRKEIAQILTLLRIFKQQPISEGGRGNPQVSPV